jgi:hypothetical protein
MYHQLWYGVVDATEYYWTAMEVAEAVRVVSVEVVSVADYVGVSVEVASVADYVGVSVEVVSVADYVGVVTPVAD